jgi:hypothetical protein
MGHQSFFGTLLGTPESNVNFKKLKKIKHQFEVSFFDIKLYGTPKRKRDT